MLKLRIIPLLILQDGLLKKPIQFKQARTIANPISIVQVFEQRQVDELILVDRGVTADGEEADPGLVKQIAEKLYVPFAFGGGIHSIANMKEIIQAGAEKVVINTAAINNPGLITASAKKFGSQCIVVSIDAAQDNNGQYQTYTHNGTQATGLHPVKWAQQVEQLGAGEILINSIQHDGMMNGFNIELVKLVSQAVKIPVIAAGGAGKPDDFLQLAQQCRVSAIAAGSIFHYTKFTPNMIKGVLNQANIPVRLYADQDYATT